LARSITTVSRNQRARCSPVSGFSLLEVLAAVAILLVVLMVVLEALAGYQKIFRSQQGRAGVQLGLDGTLESLEQEIGQAGYLGYLPRQLLSSVVASPAAQTVPLSSTAWLFNGEKVLVEPGSNSETVTLQGVGGGTIQAVFTRSHAAGAVVVPVGVFPQGVLTATDGNQLRLVGDINGDGSLWLVEYDCDYTHGILQRTAFAVVQTQPTTVTSLLGGLVPNPDGSPCFRFASISYGGYTLVTAVRVTLTASTLSADQLTGTPASMTASVVIVPRNIVQAARLLQPPLSQPDLLQPTPAWPQP
jgi:prepilin-type N-terminal cleavage/methylation domain-containing protein